MRSTVVGHAVGLQAEHRVVAAEAERVRDRGTRLAVRAASGRAAPGHVVEVEALVGLLEVSVGGATSSRSASTRRHRLDRAGGAEQVADRRLRRGDGHLGGALAERRLQRLGLGAVVERRRGAVGVDVVDVVRARARRRRSARCDRARGAVALGLGRGQVVGVGGRAVAADLAEDRRAARLGRLARPRARARPRPRPSRSRRGGGRRAARCRPSRSRPSAAKAAMASGGQRRLGAAGDAGVGLAGCDHPRGRADRVGAGGAGRDRAVALAAEAVAHRDRRPRRRWASSAARRAARRALAPASRSTSCWSSSVARPPMPVPITQPTSVGLVRQARRASPASAIASSAAASASWVKRSARRASCGSGVGRSNSAQRPSRPRSRTRRPSSARAASGADAERGDGADAGDDDRAGHAGAARPPGRRRRRRSRCPSGRRPRSRRRTRPRRSGRARPGRASRRRGPRSVASRRDRPPAPRRTRPARR